MISVIIPLYNKEKSITDTVNSVLNQTFKDFELIIVNDGSKDNSLSVVNKFTDKRVKIIDKPNGGVSSARNVGILNAKYEYIAFLDGDDIWYNKHLEILFNAIQNLDDDNIGGFGTTFYKSHAKFFDIDKYKSSTPVIIEDYFDFMASPLPRFNSSTLLVKKSKVLKTGLFDENLKYGEDVEFWYKLFSEYKIVYINSVTTIYYVAAENRSVHYVMPLEKRFHQFNYTNKSKTEKKYLDKLVAIMLIDFYLNKSYGNLFLMMGKYKQRLIGVILYILKLVKKKF